MPLKKYVAQALLNEGTFVWSVKYYGTFLFENEDNHVIYVLADNLNQVIESIHVEHDDSPLIEAVVQLRVWGKPKEEQLKRRNEPQEPTV